MLQLFSYIANGFEEMLINLGTLFALIWSMANLSRLGTFRKIHISPNLKQYLKGLAFGVTACILINYPIIFEPGIIADARAVPIFLSGAYFGLIPGLMTGAFAFITRLFVGGMGMYGGLIYITVFTIAGIVFHFGFKTHRQNNIRLIFAISIMTIFTAPIALTFPEEKQLPILLTLWPNMLIANIIGTFLFNILFKKESEFLEIVNKQKIFMNLLEQVQVGIWELDIKENTLKWDKSMFELYEVNPMDFTSDFEAWSKTVHPQDINRASDEFELALKQIKDFDTSFRIITGEGKIKYIAAKAEVVFNENKQAVFVRGFNWDITEKIQADEEVNATSRLASIGELSSSLAHELNNPLTIVVGCSEQLRRRAEELSFEDQKIKMYLSNIQKASKRVEGIIAGLSKITRRSSDGFTKVDLVGATKETIDLVKSLTETEVIDFEVAIEEKPVFVYGEQNLIQQVIMNLVNNAKDALSDSSNKKIIFSLKEEGDFVEIRVGDNGPGIPDEIVEKIFNIFFTTKSSHDGTGIGLYLCKKIIDRHRGTIKVETGEWGTVFTVQIPLYRLPSKKSVLIVDDEQGIREILRDYLEALDCRVEEAENGFEAMKILKEKSFSHIFTDIKMPVMNGEEFLTELYSLDYEVMPAVIVVSGHVHPDDENINLYQKANKIILKPFSEKEIIECLNIVNE